MERGTDVLVVGAGMAGLVCATELAARVDGTSGDLGAVRPMHRKAVRKPMGNRGPSGQSPLADVVQQVRDESDSALLPGQGDQSIFAEPSQPKEMSRDVVAGQPIRVVAVVITFAQSCGQHRDREDHVIDVAGADPSQRVSQDPFLRQFEQPPLGDSRSAAAGAIRPAVETRGHGPARITENCQIPYIQGQLGLDRLTERVARQASFGNGGGHDVAATSRCASRSTAARFRCSLTCTYGAAEDTSLQPSSACSSSRVVPAASCSEATKCRSIWG